MKYLALILLVTNSFCNSNSHNKLPEELPKIQTKDDSLCTLINKSNQKVNFVYYDRFGNDIQFFIEPDGKRIIKLDSFIVLIQPNTFQNNYFITKADSIDISVNKNNNIILSSKRDSTENKSLNVSTYINERLNYSSMQLSALIASKKIEYTRLDSIVMDNHNKQLELLNEYNQKVGVSKIVKDYFEFDFKSSLVNYKFYIGQRYKLKLSGAYNNQLDSFNNKLDELYLNKFSNRNGNLRISFLAYKYGNSNERISNDTLYSYCKIDVQNKITDEAKFWIVKNELERNKKSVKWFIKDFLDNSPNKELSDYITSQQSNNDVFYNATGNNKLLSLVNSKLNYDSLIKGYAGSVIYLDLWASWCAPCRANMYASYQLKEKLKDKNFIILYLSIDENIQSWRNANKEEGLTMKESFLLLNSKNTSLIKNFKINSIPRYIIIGKDGKIINANAPSPNEPSLLTNLLKLL